MRFFFFVTQTIKVLFFSALVFGLATYAGYTLVRTHIRGQEVVVPNVTGTTVDIAARMLLDKKTDLSIKIEGFDFSDLVGENEIVSQFPQPGNSVKVGTVLRVRVSRGTTLVTCPDVRGKNYLEAGILLRQAGLEEGAKSYLDTTEFKKDLVFSQDPPPQAMIERGIAVNLLISEGPARERIRMPYLLDLTTTEAEALLRRVGLRITGQREAPAPEKDNNLIIEQNPHPGAPVAPGDPVEVTVVRNTLL